MLDFFLALFGGLFYGGRYLIEKGDEKRAEAERAQQRIRDFKFRSEMYNPKLEYEIEKKLSDPAYADWIKAETEDVLSMLPERSSYLSAIHWSTEYDEIPRILLAKQGFLKESVFLRCRPNYAISYSRLNALTRWICEELARHGHDIVVANIPKGSTSYEFIYRPEVVDPYVIARYAKPPHYLCINVNPWKLDPREDIPIALDGKPIIED